MTSVPASPEPLWTPPDAGKNAMALYRSHINRKFNLSLRDSQELHKWTVTHPHEFWIDLYSYLRITPSLPPNTTRAYDDTIPMRDIPRFFEGVKINWAENAYAKCPGLFMTALIEIREGQDIEGTHMTWRDLWEQVRQTRSALIRSGVKQGDRVASLVGTSIWAVVIFLASASMGAIFTSMAPDLGTEGCVSRLKQVTPAILFADGDISYKGRRTSLLSKINDIVKQLPNSPEVIVIPIAKPVTGYTTVEKFLDRQSFFDKLQFTRVNFMDPLLICYSSGTTGAPKCIIHHHGIILQRLKDSLIHHSLRPGDVVNQFTSTTWVVFYVMNGHLAAGATCILYDGSPMYPDMRLMPRILERHKVAIWGTSPRYLLELANAGVVPNKEFNLSNLRQICTTGAPLTADQYRYVYSSFPKTVLLANAAGGTETCTSVINIDPDGPLHGGEMQLLGLGMDVDVLDPDTGASILSSGADGEMVIRAPFPSMPPRFWGDDNNTIYKKAFFERWDSGEGQNVWAVGDWLAYRPKTKGWVMSGRSDGTLNPSGIRFGSGEIYAITEAPPFTTDYGVDQTLCVGRRRPSDKDENVFLFVKMAPGHTLSSELKETFRSVIGKGLSMRHIPKFIEEVKDIPVTVNGKKIETVVKGVISGKTVKVSSTVANPKALEEYGKFVDLEAAPKSRSGAKL